MRPILLSAGIALLMAACAGPPANEWTEDRADAIRDSVRAFLAEYAARVERSDWEGVGALYSDDPAFVWVEDGRVAYDSAREVRESLARVAGMFSSARTEFLSPEVTPLAPGLAILASEFRHTFAMEDGDDLELEGAITATVAHEGGGWRFVSGHTSTARSE